MRWLELGTMEDLDGGGFGCCSVMVVVVVATRSLANVDVQDSISRSLLRRRRSELPCCLAVTVETTESLKASGRDSAVDICKRTDVITLSHAMLSSLDWA